MKIVVSSKHYHPTLGGSIRYAEMLAETFHKKGCQVVVITRTPSEVADTSPWEVFRNPGLKKQWELACWADILMQVDASWKDALPFLLRGVPWFPTVHNGKVKSDRRLSSRLGRLGQSIAYHFGNTIPVSESVRMGWNIRGASIANPYDNAVFNFPEAGSLRDIDMLFVGRVVRSKGIFIWLDALKHLDEPLRSPLRCGVVGEGADLTELKRRAPNLGPNFQFTFYGKLDSPDVAGLMKRSRVLVFPTTPDWVEASPLTLLEAQACGCRVVATDNGGTRENLGPETGIAPSGDARAFANVLLPMLAVDRDLDVDAITNFLKPRNLESIGDLYLDRFRSVISS